MGIGKLKKTELRELGPHEAYDFTKGLIKEENLEELSNELGLSLIEPEIEKNVNSFKCDIYCKEESNNTNVIIENQLELSNHEHLGKIIAYASGLDASIIIGIVKEARIEHITAISGLNKISSEDVWFFLLEIHVYKINDSLPAPKFEIIVKPDEYLKAVRTSTLKKESNLNLKQLEFGNNFNDFLRKNNSILNPRKAKAKGFYSLAMGSSKCELGIGLANTLNKVEVMVYIHDDKEFFDKLEEEKDKINENISYELIGDRLDGKKDSKIYTVLFGLDLDNNSNDEKLMGKILNILTDLSQRFKEYIK